MTLGYSLKDDGQGNVTLSCDKSGRPLNRTDKLGMFCDAEPCTCEIEAYKLDQSFLSYFGIETNEQ